MKKAAGGPSVWRVAFVLEATTNPLLSMRPRLFLRPLPLLLLLATACTDRNNRETAPQGECRLQTVTTTATSSLYAFTERTTYEYNGAGNLLKKTTTNATRYTDPQLAKLANRDQTTTTAYTYDAEGFLKTSEYEFLDNHVKASGQPATERHWWKRTFTYAGGRLAGCSEAWSANENPPSTFTYAYEYDGSGNLLRLRRTTSTGFVATHAFEQNRLVDYVENQGGVEQRPFVLQNGLVTAYTIAGGWRGVYAYDGQQRLVKMEEFANGKLQSYFTQTFDTGKPATDAEPTFKGFPAVAAPGSSPWFGQAGLPAGKKQYFANSQTGAEQFYSETTWVNRLNGQGFVENAVKTESFKNPQTLPQRVEATTTYAYAGCE